MKKLLLVISAAAMCAACEMENDMMIPKDVAGFEVFEIEGQLSSSINTSRRTVVVTMPDIETAPEYTSLKSLTVSRVKYTEKTMGKESLIAAGNVLDLSDTLTVRLYAFREYDWKLIAVHADPKSPDEPDEGPQLYNMSFDDWTQEGKGWFPYASDASDSDKAIWTTANKGTSDLLGKNTTEPETAFLAVEGDGKKAAKLSSKYFLIKFAAGNLFTGEFCGLKGTKGADLAWGVPFTGRPKSLTGWYCYQPVNINYADEAHSGLKGKLDIGQIQIILADWDRNPNSATDDEGRFHVINSDEQFVDVENDPAIIGYANFEFSEWMDSYRQFELEIEYRSERNPTVVAIVAASSRYGDYFTGGEGTVLYLDEFAMKY